MNLMKVTPCDHSGVCPYNAETSGSCEYWCGASEPADDPEVWEDDCDYEVGYDPYMGCYTDDC